MTKLNFVQAQHSQALSYVAVRSDPAVDQEPKKTLSDRLGDLAVDVMVVAAAFCGATGFMFWLFVILALA